MLSARLLKFSDDMSGLTLADVALPTPDSEEVLVRINACSVSPSDLKNLQGHMEGTSLPRTPGRDFAGTVVAGTPQLLGKTVYGTGGDIGFTRDGSHAEFLLVPRSGVAVKPDSLTMLQAAAAGVNFVTAYRGLISIGKLQPGETLLVIGASGGVGSAVVQLAALHGTKIIALDRSKGQDTDSVHSFEFHTLKDSAADIRSFTGDRGVDLVFDTVGGDQFELGLMVLAHGGRQLNISSTGNRRVSFDLIDFYHREARLFGVDSRVLDTTASAGILNSLRDDFERGALTPPAIGSTYSLTDVLFAYQDVAGHRSHGKVMLTPHSN